MIRYFLIFCEICINKYKKRDDVNHVSWFQLISYCSRQFFHLYKGTFTTSLKSYKKINNEIASIDVADRKLFLPTSLKTNDIILLLREALDLKHWHQYDTPYTPVTSDDIVVDCGTSEGIWAASVINKVKKLYLIEPQYDYSKILLKTFSSDSDKEKTEIINCALGSIDGYCNVHGIGNDAAIKIDNEGHLPIYKLDTLLKDKSISFLKADIEGFELEMLKGATETIKKNKPKIAITVYHPENNWKEIKDFLSLLVPEYKFRRKGLIFSGKPLMLHAWI